MYTIGYQWRTPMRERYRVRYRVRGGNAIFGWYVLDTKTGHAVSRTKTRKEAREKAFMWNLRWQARLGAAARKVAARAALKAKKQHERRLLKAEKSNIAALLATVQTPFVVTEHNYKELRKLKDTDRVIMAFKVSDNDGFGPYHGHRFPQLICKVGNVLSVPSANTNWRQSCAVGVNVGTLRWIEHDQYPFSCRVAKQRVWVVKFRGHDIAALPRQYIGSVAKFRLFRALVTDELTRTQYNFLLKEHEKQP